MIAAPPTDDELRAIIEKIGNVDPRYDGGKLYANHLHWHLYNIHDGHYRRMSRRQWIERYVKIKDKDGNIVPLIFNAPQRRLLAMLLRMERAGVPVRIIILKARQIGFSTVIQAFFYERRMRKSHVSSLIIAHRSTTSAQLLKIAHTMIRHHNKEGMDETWKLRMELASTYKMAWVEPYYCNQDVTSAEVKDPGHGDTRQHVHMSEVALWPRPEATIRGLVPILPDAPGTMGFMESTADGDEGLFRDFFWDSWKERDVPITSPRRTTPWQAMFVAWWQNDEYRWSNTFGRGRAIPEEMVKQIEETLDKEEKWLLGQRFYVRGLGWKNVDVDQLIWRRRKIKELGLGRFHEQFPARPEEAFRSSGTPAYNHELVRELIDRARERPPVFVGDVVVRSRVA